MNADGASDVDRFRPGVSKHISQTLREPALQLDAHGVVVCLAAPVDLLESAQLGIRRARRDRQRHIGRGVSLVECPQRFEPPAYGTEVTDLERRVPTQLA